jgi:hypothetical protein
MLERMGWERGQGLGREKAGMKDAIEVVKKEDTLGVRILPCGHAMKSAAAAQPATAVCAPLLAPPLLLLVPL